MLPTVLQTALEALYGTTRRPSLCRTPGIKVPPCFIVVCQNTAISKLVYDHLRVRGGRTKTAHVTLQENGRLPVPATLTAMATNWPARTRCSSTASSSRRATRWTTSSQHGGGRNRAIPREIIERSGDVRAADNITDQELLREVMNTVGKPDTLGGSIRCVVSVSMLTEGRTPIR